MPSTVWPNPPGGSRLPEKRFFIEMSRQRVPTPQRMLDWILLSFDGIDSGQTWKSSGQLMTRPDVGPGVYEIEAKAPYQFQGSNGVVSLYATTQPSSDGIGIGLVLSYTLSTDNVAFWADQISERYVALTTLHIGDSMGQAAGYNRPPNANPIGSWSWYEPSCGWMSNTQILYGGWQIALGG